MLRWMGRCRAPLQASPQVKIVIARFNTCPSRPWGLRIQCARFLSGRAPAEPRIPPHAIAFAFASSRKRPVRISTDAATVKPVQAIRTRFVMPILREIPAPIRHLPIARTGLFGSSDSRLSREISRYWRVPDRSKQPSDWHGLDWLLLQKVEQHRRSQGDSGLPRRLLPQHFLNTRRREHALPKVDNGGFVGGIKASKGVRSELTEFKLNLPPYERAVASLLTLLK